MKPKIILALDVDTFEKAKYFVNKLYPQIKIFKVGSQLFTACGPEIVEFIRKKGAEVFLDLKYHDIPNTVKHAVEAAKKLKVFMLTVHASGGKEMLNAAASVKRHPLIIAVTVLTSKQEKDTAKKVLSLAKIAKISGVDGVVCSPLEAKAVKNAFGKKFIVITPGIRPAATASADQKRIATPQEAIRAGSDFLVVGRPILEAKDPLLVVRKILEETWQRKSRI